MVIIATLLHVILNPYQTMKTSLYVWSALLGLLLVSSCDEDPPAPAAENEEEVITHVTVTFIPDGGGQQVEGTWVDADGPGIGQPVVSEITLAPNTTYTMNIALSNRIDPDQPEDITEEVDEEGDAHQFFFSWTEGLFTNPAGDGNIDSQEDEVLYQDSDENSRPVGLETRWTTDRAATGTFRLLLVHQPGGIKSDTSTANDGEPDVDVTWEVTVQ